MLPLTAVVDVVRCLMGSAGGRLGWFRCGVLIIFLVESVVQRGSVDDIQSSVIFGAQSRLVNIRRGGIAILPLKLGGESIPPSLEILFKRLAGRDF